MISSFSVAHMRLEEVRNAAGMAPLQWPAPENTGENLKQTPPLGPTGPLWRADNRAVVQPPAAEKAAGWKTTAG